MILNTWTLFICSFMFRNTSYIKANSALYSSRSVIEKVYAQPAEVIKCYMLVGGDTSRLCNETLGETTWL